MRKKNSASKTEPKTDQEVPDWAKKIKSYREEAGITQGDIQKAFKAKYNVMSPTETGRRKFTSDERKAFFELVSKPEDTSIPITDRNLVPAAPKKAAKPVKQVVKGKEKGRGVKPTDKPAKVAKAGRARKAKIAPVAPPAPLGKKLAPAPEPVPSMGASTASVEVPMPDAKAAAAPKAGRKPRAPKHIDAAPLKPATAQIKPIKAGSAPKPAISPVKEAVLRDISRVLSSPGLSDNQAKRLHGLFTSLAVNALLGE